MWGDGTESDSRGKETQAQEKDMRCLAPSRVYWMLVS